jgi:superfamily II RNA helicase
VRSQDLAVIEHTRRPVPLSHRLFHQDAGVFQLEQRQRAITFHERPRRATSATASARAAARRERSRWGDKRERGQGRRIPFGPRPYVQLLDEVQHRQLLPLLYFCFSRKECEIKAERSMGRRLLDRAERARIEAMFDEICARFELDPEPTRACAASSAAPSPASATTTPACCRSTRKWSSGCSRRAC